MQNDFKLNRNHYNKFEIIADLIMIRREIISSLRALLPFLGKGSIYMGKPSSLPLIQPWAAEGRGRAASSSTGAADFELNHVCQFRSQRGRAQGQDQDGQVGGSGAGGPLLWRPHMGKGGRGGCTLPPEGKKSPLPCTRKMGTHHKKSWIYSSLYPLFFSFLCACLFFQSNWVVATVSKWLKNHFYLATANYFSIC